MGVSVYWPLTVLCVFLCVCVCVCLCVCVCVCVCVRSYQSTMKKLHSMSDLSILIVCALSLSAGEWGEGGSLLPNFLKSGVKKEVTFFRGVGLQFLQKKLTKI